jgi:hypothetical protein
MRVCPKCGYKDNPLWQHSRFDYNADYMRFEEAINDKFLSVVCEFLKDKENFVPFDYYGLIYYRRGTGGIYLYRVAKEDFRVPRERKYHKKALELKRLLEVTKNK